MKQIKLFVLVLFTSNCLAVFAGQGVLVKFVNLTEIPMVEVKGSSTCWKTNDLDGIGISPNQTIQVYTEMVASGWCAFKKSSMEFSINAPDTVLTSCNTHRESHTPEYLVLDCNTRPSATKLGYKILAEEGDKIFPYGGKYTLTITISKLPVISFSQAGPIDGQICTSINEPADPSSWGDNYVCSSTDIKLKWSSAGKIEGHTCTHINEPSEPAEHTWNDNFLCLPLDSKFELEWSHNGQHSASATNFNEHAEPAGHTWKDNFLSIKYK